MGLIPLRLPQDSIDRAHPTPYHRLLRCAVLWCDALCCAGFFAGTATAANIIRSTNRWAEITVRQSRLFPGLLPTWDARAKASTTYSKVGVKAIMRVWHRSVCKTITCSGKSQRRYFGKWRLRPKGGKRMRDEKQRKETKRSGEKRGENK